jgi:hypothetical protein
MGISKSVIYSCYSDFTLAYPKASLLLSTHGIGTVTLLGNLPDTGITLAWTEEEAASRPTYLYAANEQVQRSIQQRQHTHWLGFHLQ